MVIHQDRLQLEDQLLLLSDQEFHRKFRRQVEEEAGKLSTDDWRNFRKLAKTNLFFLATAILGFDKLSVDLHGDLIRWMEETKNWAFRLLLLPRGHYKSTIWTIAHAIQCALPDDSGSEPWPYCLGPDIRICIMHETEKTASKFLSSVQNHFLSNVALMRLFPECIPTPGKQTINTLQFELPRSRFWAEKTFEVMGVGAKSQGNHYNLLKPDDLIGKEAANSETIMESTKEWVDNIQSFLTSFSAGDRIDFTGTRWAHDDLWYHIMETYGDDIAVYKRAVEEKQEDGTLKSIFPEEYPRERLAILRKNRKVFSAQYLNDPDSDGSDFDVDNLRYYYWKSRKEFIAFDREVGGNVEHSKDELHKLLLIDPADTGKYGVVVTGNTKKNKIIVLEAIKGEYSRPKFLDLCCSLILKWGIKKMVVEKVVFSSLYEDLLVAEFLKRNIKCEVVLQQVPKGKPGAKRNEGKLEKLKSLAVYLDAGQLYINEQQVELWNEIRTFGKSADVHLLDSLWLGSKHWRPYNPELDDTQTPQVLNSSSRLDKVSGYSSV